MTSTPPLDLDAIQARADAATPGPWGVYQYGGDSLIEIAADLEDTGTGYSARRTIARFDEEPLDNDPGHREWTAEEDWAQVQADAAYIAAMPPEVTKALVAEVRRLRAELAAVTTLCNEQEMAARLFEFPTPEWITAVRRAIETAAEETHVVADDSDDPEHVDDCPGCETAETPLDIHDTIWLQQRPCGCIVAGVVAVVPGEWKLATAEQAHAHFNPTPWDLARAADAQLTVVPVTGRQYREQYQARWRCDQHATPAVLPPSGA
ncbi:hypothetical protein L0F81_00010 [Streptomyces tricolor]|uniref:Uncharacterized protein n=1 Tax=Streptomyces tricolor TaxID=68277 RepID=A0ABS9J7Y9_9ACTN|nr:hypothetical protein [Streptomyces tricolor]MCG0061682.1 hypothetical protein [Streptomyces tricolor]